MSSALWLSAPTLENAQLAIKWGPSGGWAQGLGWVLTGVMTTH